VSKNMSSFGYSFIEERESKNKYVVEPPNILTNSSALQTVTRPIAIVRNNAGLIDDIVMNNNLFKKRVMTKIKIIK
jgi:hypothetical protein